MDQAGPSTVSLYMTDSLNRRLSQRVRQAPWSGVEDFMGRTLLAAGSVLLALTIGNSALAGTPKAVEPGKACISAQDWATAVRDKSTGVAIRVLTDLDGLEAKQVVERVNAEPPKTQMSA